MTLNSGMLAKPTRELHPQMEPPPAKGVHVRVSELVWLALAFFLTRLMFLFTVPMSECPDEATHFWVIQHIVQHGSLPAAAQVSAAGLAGVYGSLPPLGYAPHILSAAMLGAASDADIALAARFGSLAIGFIFLLITYRLGLELFPRERWLAVSLPTVIVFHPQLAFLQAYANSDSTAVTLAAFILLLLVKTVHNGIKLPLCAIIGAAAGWLILSKYSGFAVAPAVLVVLIGSAILHGQGVWKGIAALATTAGVALAVSGWWFARNFFEYPGDILGTKTMYRTWALACNKDLNYYLSPLDIVLKVGWWRMMFFSFWGMFGFMTKYMWRPLYFAYLGYVLVAAIGWWRWNSSWTRPADSSRTILIWGAIALTVVTNLAAMIWASTLNLGGAQGRYLLTSEAAVIALILAGLNKYSPRFAKPLVLSFLVFNVCVCFYAWMMLYQSYGGWHLRPM